MIDTIKECIEKQEELDKIQQDISAEIIRVLDVILKFFRPYDRMKQDKWAGEWPSSQYVGWRTDKLPGYWDEFRLYDDKISVAGDYYDYDETERNSITFNVKFFTMSDSEIEACLEEEYREKLAAISEKAAQDKAEAEEKKRVTREKKIQREKEKLKELLVKYYPNEDLQLPAAYNNLDNDV